MENQRNVPVDRCKEETLRHRVGEERGSAKRGVGENLREVSEGLIDDAMGTILAISRSKSVGKRVREGRGTKQQILSK